MANYQGQIDFTLLCRLWKKHKELFYMADFQDGQHALLSTTLHERKEEDGKGNTHYLQADCKKSDRKDGLNYYIGSRWKEKSFGNTAKATENTTVDSEEDLPF